MGHSRDHRYAARSQDDLADLLAAQPMAWLVSAGGDDAAFTPLPLRAVRDRDGALVALRGHLARRNPHVARLRRDPHAQALVLGPHAYVSPGWLDDRTQAPTWNYAAAAFALRITLSEAPDDIDAELQALAAQMEAGRENAWRPEEMGARYARLATGVTALHGEVVGVRATFKLGQDEAAHDFAQILQGLSAAGEDALVRWMRAFDARGADRGAPA